MFPVLLENVINKHMLKSNFHLNHHLIHGLIDHFLLLHITVTPKYEIETWTLKTLSLSWLNSSASHH